ncbi:sulfite exporter TauE/SafE family protein [Roseibium litorale]|uniref:Probable membrane transporter protein n=1 Tax=Roseibium litorale TaxID=2803841 RepID=A0ABR9CMV8_9HYPH|nr:sulfite exporter TauE/SafE family protein [Roseibium litorale]MBD8892033.1 sulfite exporter TauE/SafE family protein [Roseibium litorale]
MFSDLLPAAISPLSALVLILSSFAASALTAAVGLGGGVALIAVMANLMPPLALVPVHGLVQLGSNGGRAIVQRRYIDPAIAAWFAGGAIVGAALGGYLAVSIPAAWLRIGIAGFVLWTVWGRVPKLGHARKQAMGIAGFIGTSLSMFFGATGPIGGSVLSTLGLTRHQFVANQAVTSLTMHVCKVAAFGFLGFAFGPWIGLIVLMITSGFLGTLAGTRMLGRMQEETFRKGFKLVMTLLAANLIWQALPGLSGS